MSGTKEHRIKHWDKLTYQGQTYSLDHLDAFETVVNQAATDSKPERTYRFVVEFGLHCFTKGPNANKGETLTDYPTALHYSDSRETRIFCFERFGLSSRLPDIARRISEYKCYHTGKGNYFIIELIENGESVEYEVYFTVTKHRKGVLRLFITSAYVRTDDYGSSQPEKKKISFFIIAFNTLNNRPIKVPK